jgi:SAM-dependent methyltransferase
MQTRLWVLIAFLLTGVLPAAVCAQAALPVGAAAPDFTAQAALAGLALGLGSSAQSAGQSSPVIGLGGGGIVPLLEQGGMRVEGVDLSPDVIDLAKSRFGLKLPDAQLHAADGRVYLRENPGRFDAVVLDVFNGDRVPFSVLTKEGLQAAKASLKAGGILALNTWGIDLEKGGPDKLGAALRNTLQEVFPHVLAVPASGNLLLFASDEPITPQRGSVVFETFDGPLTFAWLGIPPTTWPDAPVLTDDWNPADMIDARAVEDLRASRRTSLPATLRHALAWE